MSNPKSKILPSVFSTFAVVLILFCVDAFAPMLMGDLAKFGTNVIGAVLGIITVVVASFAKGRNLASFGLIFDPIRIIRGFAVGGSMAFAPLALLYGVKYVLYAIFKFDSFKPDFVLPNSPDGISLVSAGIFLAACIISAMMQELVFRGFVIRSMRPQYPFLDANIIQASLSVSLPLMLVIRNIVFGHYNHFNGMKKIIFIVAVILFYIVYTFFSSIKRGIVTRVSGDIWPSFFGNFAFMFFGGCLFIQGNMIKSFIPMLFLLVAEFISLIVARGYYKRQYVRNVKRKEEHDQRVAKRKEKLHQEELDHEEDPNVEGLSQRSVKEIMEQQQQKIFESVGAHSRPVQPENDDTIADLGEVKLKEDIKP